MIDIIIVFADNFNFFQMKGMITRKTIITIIISLIKPFSFKNCMYSIIGNIVIFRLARIFVFENINYLVRLFRLG